MDPTTRRSFVRKSLATTVSITFTGLIRAHGEGGGGTTNTTAWETTMGTTDSGTTNTTGWETTYETYATTLDPFETTVDTTIQTTVVPGYDIETITFECPSGTAFSVSNGYGESAHFPTAMPGTAQSTTSFSKLKAWQTPANLSPTHPNVATVSVEAEVWVSVQGAPGQVQRTYKSNWTVTADRSDGSLTSTASFSPIGPNAPITWNENGNAYSVEVSIGNVTVTPSGSNLVITGDMTRTFKENGVVKGSNPPKSFTISLHSHLHGS